MIVHIALVLFCSVLGVTSVYGLKWYRQQRQHKAYLQSFVIGSAKPQTALVSTVFSTVDRQLLQTGFGKRGRQVLAQYNLSEEIKLSQLIVVLFGLIGICWNLSGFLHIPLLPLLVFTLCVMSLILFYLLKNRRVSTQLDQHFSSILDSLSSIYQINPDLKQSFITAEVLSQTKVAKTILHEINQRTQVGVSLRTSLEMTAQKWLYQPLQFLISAITLHQRSGGDLALLLKNSAAAHRRQLHNKQAMQAVMFQNKVSALIVCSLVPFILLFSLMLSENYRLVMMTEPTARLLVVAACVWWCLGVVVMWRALRVRV